MPEYSAAPHCVNGATESPSTGPPCPVCLGRQVLVTTDEPPAELVCTRCGTAAPIDNPQH